MRKAYLLLALMALSLAQCGAQEREPRVSAAVLFPEPDEIAPPEAVVSGELREWHKVTLTIDGPRASQYGNTVLEFDEETAELRLDVRPQAGPGGRLGYMHPNPFLDYRMTVTFTHESGESSYEVPGYFAADGNAAESGAISGNKWRAHLSPDRTGRWDWRVSFVAGMGVALAADAAGQPYVPYDGMSGSFQVATTDKGAPDFRARGRLEYVREHYLRFAGTGEYFLKAGADAPETLLAYADFDGTKTMMEPDGRAWIGPADGHGLHEYAVHVQDWREGDPTWRDGKGRGLIGAINYLASKGMNAMSFIPYTAGGDGENVWPFVSRNDKLHYDVSKLDQWQIVFDHAQRKGIFLHFKLQEQENDAGFPHRKRQGPHVPVCSPSCPTVPEALDGGAVGPERKLYTRELIARFGYALALNWNLGEENTNTHEHIREWAEYIAAIDPYNHHRVIHTGGSVEAQEEMYVPLLGESTLTGPSVQINDYDDVHWRTLRWVTASREAGKPWAVANDEQGPASFGVPPDPGYDGWDGLDREGNPVHDLHDIRKYTLWGNLMAGGWGVEYYFGYQAPHNDLVAESWRSRERSWDYARIALEFFGVHDIPFWEMENCNARVGNHENDNSRYCFGKAGELYLVYLPDGAGAEFAAGTAELPDSAAELDLSGTTGPFHVSWYDPRNGGALRRGSVALVEGGATVSLGAPPEHPNEDWLAVVRSASAQPTE